MSKRWYHPAGTIAEKYPRRLTRLIAQNLKQNVGSIRIAWSDKAVMPWGLPGKYLETRMRQSKRLLCADESKKGVRNDH